MNWKQRAGTCLLAIFVLLSLGLEQPARGHRLQPQEIYRRAWQLVRDNYYNQQTLNEVNWTSYEHKYDGQMKNTQDAYNCIEKSLKVLKDPYTRFLSPNAFEDESQAIESKVVGIGVRLQQTKDKAHLMVMSVIEGGPAAEAGILAGDEVIGINNNTAVGLTPDQAAERIRGAAGTEVQVSTQHSGVQRTFKIVRREIIIKAVASKVLEPNIGYIHLSTFISNDASREFRQALEKLSKTDGLIVDLRDNPGGLLSNALEIADMLLDNGLIVTTVGRHGKHSDLASGEPVTHQPVVLLVDEDSASASEILAGAIKDNGRGIIIGTRTYGKGLVQEINRLPGGAAIHITVSSYCTPNGTDINKKVQKDLVTGKEEEIGGIVPDINVPKKEEQVKVALEYLKEKIASLKPIKTSSLSPFGFEH